MHVLSRIGVGAAAVAAAAISVALAPQAGADTSAQSGDAVIVGSDTVQNSIDFALDGYPGVTGGYNVGGNLNRGVSYDATGDANGRAVYDGTCGTVNTGTGVGTNCDSTTNAAANLLAGSVVLRAGTKPVVRPNGSGNGVKALIADAGSGYQNLPTGSIQIARMSRLPNPSGGEEDACTTSSSCGGLHVYQIATDDLSIAHVASGYNGPSAGLSASTLAKIYTCQITTWNQIPGNSGGSTATIRPLIPQSGSGTRNFFLADLASANGGTAPTPGSCTRTVQEHDPSGVYTDPSPANAIEPFSVGKLALINKGYFANGVSPSTNKAFTPNYLAADAKGGTATDGSASFYDTRGLYLVVRNPDVSSTTAFQPGSTANFVKALITNSTSAIRSASGRSLIQAAGFTPAYFDCGVNPSGCDAG